MNEWNIFVGGLTLNILLNVAYIIFLAAFMAKKIVWLRVLTISGNILVVPYYLYFKKHLCGITFSGFVSML